MDRNNTRYSPNTHTNTKHAQTHKDTTHMQKHAGTHRHAQHTCAHAHTRKHTHRHNTRTRARTHTHTHAHKETQHARRHIHKDTKHTNTRHHTQSHNTCAYTAHARTHTAHATHTHTTRAHIQHTHTQHTHSTRTHTRTHTTRTHSAHTQHTHSTPTHSTRTHTARAHTQHTHNTHTNTIHRLRSVTHRSNTAALCQCATNFTATCRHSLRLLTFHLYSAFDIPTFESRQQHALSDPQWSSGTQALLTRHTEPGDHMASDPTPCRRMSGYRRFEGSSCLHPRRQTIQEPGDTVSRPIRPESSSLCTNVFRAEFHLHAPINDGLARRQIYRVHP